MENHELDLRLTLRCMRCLDAHELSSEVYYTDLRALKIRLLCWLLFLRLVWKSWELLCDTYWMQRDSICDARLIWRYFLCWVILLLASHLVQRHRPCWIDYSQFVSLIVEWLACRWILLVLPRKAVCPRSPSGQLLFAAAATAPTPAVLATFGTFLIARDDGRSLGMHADLRIVPACPRFLNVLQDNTAAVCVARVRVVRKGLNATLCLYYLLDIFKQWIGHNLSCLSLVKTETPIELSNGISLLLMSLLPK